MACVLTEPGSPYDDGDLGGPSARPCWADLVDDMAAALRELRPHIPHHAWWQSGAASALLEYEATRGR